MRARPSENRIASHITRSPRMPRTMPSFGHCPVPTRRSSAACCQRRSSCQAPTPSGDANARFDGGVACAVHPLPQTLRRARVRIISVCLCSATMPYGDSECSPTAAACRSGKGCVFAASAGRASEREGMNDLIARCARTHATRVTPVAVGPRHIRGNRIAAARWVLGRQQKCSCQARHAWEPQLCVCMPPSIPMYGPDQGVSAIASTGGSPSLTFP